MCSSLPDPHEGINTSVPLETTLQSFIYGTVVLTGDNGKATYGKFILIQDDYDNKKYYLCGHLAKVEVEIDENVIPGQIVGLVGSTGNSSGPHLHLTVFMNDSEDFRKITYEENNIDKFRYKSYVIDPLNNRIMWKG
ncbi:MAG: M23 family metallopeptidase [bacterium]|nr:M23 family metallopeptidase [bacterium]